MNRKFTVVIERKQDEYEARCQEMPDAVARGCSKNDALEKIGAVITRMLEDGSDDGTAPKPHPVSPSPGGPVIIQESHEKPDT